MSASARAASCARPPTAARRSWPWPGAARAAGAAVLGFASSGLPGPKGNRETFLWLAEAGRDGALDGDAVAAAAREVEP